NSVMPQRSACCSASIVCCRASLSLAASICFLVFCFLPPLSGPGLCIDACAILRQLPLASECPIDLARAIQPEDRRQWPAPVMYKEKPCPSFLDRAKTSLQ